MSQTSSTSSPVPATTFHLFPQLPYELRHLIYSIITSPQRILHFRTNDDVETYIDGRRPLDEHLWLASPCRPPVILTINAESRRYGLRRYRSLQAPYDGLMVDPERDMWWLEHRYRDWPDYTAYAGTDIPDTSHGLSEVDKKLVRNVLVILRGSPMAQHKNVNSGISLWIKTLGGVRDVFVACRGEAGEFTWQPSHGGFPEIRDGGSVVRVGMRHWTSQMMERKKAFEEKVRRWQAEERKTWVVSTEDVRLYMLDLGDLGM